MLAKLREWVFRLSNAKQLLLFFICHWIFWFLGGILFELAWAAIDEPEGMFQVFVHSLIMAVFWTILFNFNKVKRLFKKKAAANKKPMYPLQ